MARQISTHGNRENESFGLELGYSYHSSPIILPSPTEAPSADPVSYVPTTLPGSRLPSVFLADGSNLHDHLGPWFTLLCVADCDAKCFAETASALGIPLKTARVDVSAHDALYKGPALLVRPDQHIAWRGAPESGAEAQRILVHATGGGAGRIARARASS
jgi:hypothetical protein